jgi:hypothetical protein
MRSPESGKLRAMADIMRDVNGLETAIRDPVNWLWSTTAGGPAKKKMTAAASTPARILVRGVNWLVMATPRLALARHFPRPHHAAAPSSRTWSAPRHQFRPH